MGVARYYGLLFRMALRHSLSSAQDFIFLALIALGLAAWLFGRLGMTFDAATWMQTVTTWQIATMVLGAIVVIRLLLAPYWIWKEQQITLIAAHQREAEALASTRALEERLSQLSERGRDKAAPPAQAQNMTITLAERQDCGQDERLADGQVRKWVYVVLRNVGPTPLRGVRVYQQLAHPKRNEYLGVFPLFEGDIEIEPYKKACVKLAYRDERDILGMGLSWEGESIMLCCPEGLGVQRLSKWGATLRVSAVSADSAPCEVLVRVHVPNWGFSAELG